ncbi:MAG TPA: peptidylprolyl isomerase [Acetobacteraceae bacterium]|nr:peptidylprolyl isomerase [Acetobacteraceae bacterium]
MSKLGQSLPAFGWPSRFAILLALLIVALAQPAHAQVESIAAVVNGDVITRADVDNRARLFALSSGLPMSPDMLDRLKPQILNQLIDEKLRLQEIQRKQIIVPDKAIAAALTSIEAQNHMAPGALRARLAGQGVALRTLIDQIRVELGWSELLREELGSAGNITKGEIQARIAALKAEEGQPEYLVSEIFIPIDTPSRRSEAERFATTVIDELRAGAPFGVVAAQFSQSESALQGGDLGWVQANQLDPQVVSLLNQMPSGAISDPVPVAGGLEVVQLRDRRAIGGATTETASIRQVFLPFTTPFDPSGPPSAQQRAQINKAQALASTVHDCAGMEAANQAAGAVHPADPGPIELDRVSPPSFREMLTSLPINKLSEPLIANDGVAVVMICSRGMQDPESPPPDLVARALLNSRAEVLSRQLLADLRRSAVIEIRSS